MSGKYDKSPSGGQKWSLETPDEPGFYWYIKDGSEGIAEVEMSEGQFVVHATRGVSVNDILTRKVYWGSKMVPPEVPERLRPVGNKNEDKHPSVLSG